VGVLPAELIDKFESFTRFADSMRTVPEPVWRTPLNPGKWSIGEIVAHIFLWDKYFWTEALAKIRDKERLTLKHIDYDLFNQAASGYAAEAGQALLIDETIACRAQIVGFLRTVGEEDFYVEHIDGDGSIFTLYGYLEGFVPHDAQHRREIKAFLGQTDR
jgi:hypothetical protein